MLKPAEYAAAGVPCLLAGRDRPLVELVARPARRRGFREGGWVSAGPNALTATYDVVIDAVALSAP